MKKKKQIINIEDNRMGLFMSDNSFDLDVMYGRNYIQTDNAQTVIIHKINNSIKILSVEHRTSKTYKKR